MNSPIRILALAAALLAGLAAGWGGHIAAVSADPGSAKPPATAKASATQPVFATSRADDGDTLSVLNPTAGWMTISLDVTCRNMKSSVRTPLLFALAPKEHRDLAEIKPVNPAAGYSWRYQFNYQPGNFQAKPDDRIVYRLPYEAHTRHEVGQGYHGKFSHFGVDEFAIDFVMPVGTKVCAARDGEVVAIKADSDVGGPNHGFRDKANYIQIAHADGTVANYVHLQLDGVLVKLGQQVRAGDVIGLSGNTGWSGQPHLHIDIRIPIDGRTTRTVPVKFLTGPGQAETPEEHKTYTAVDLPNPEKPAASPPTPSSQP